MSEIDTLKADLKKLSAKATTMKMNLHDLSEELPVNWQTIMQVAQDTHDAYAALDAARRKLKELEAA
jgi:hypothetical protein